MCASIAGEGCRPATSCCLTAAPTSSAPQQIVDGLSSTSPLIRVLSRDLLPCRSRLISSAVAEQVDLFLPVPSPAPSSATATGACRLLSALFSRFLLTSSFPFSLLADCTPVVSDSCYRQKITLEKRIWDRFSYCSPVTPPLVDCRYSS